MNPEKDFSNGLVGQAWTIEALAVKAKSLDDSDAQQLGEEVFLLHPLLEDLGLWQRVDVDGSYRSIDKTFNHQLWFAAAGALLLPADNQQVRSRVERFLDTIHNNMRLYPSGLIRHPLRTSHGMAGAIRGARRFLTHALRGGRSADTRRNMHHKAIGYHAFNLYALALLKQKLPEHSFWHSTQMRRALDYVRAKEYVNGLEENKYGYPYNPPGFEVAFALEVFVQDSTSEQERWVSRQLSRCYDPDTHMMARNTEDPRTLAARLYEATRLRNLPISFRIDLEWPGSRP